MLMPPRAAIPPRRAFPAVLIDLLVLVVAAGATQVVPDVAALALLVLGVAADVDAGERPAHGLPWGGWCGVESWFPGLC